MTSLSEIGRWIAENESLLSGLAALVVLAGVIFSPLGRGVRHLFSRKKETAPTPTLNNSSSEVKTARIDEQSPSMFATKKTASGTEPLLAVLAFDNFSSDPEMQFFCDGVSEDIIQRISRGTNLKVMGRTSSFQLRGERKAQAAEQLGCSHVLDGSIRRASERVRVNAHLVEAASGTTLWSDRYERELEDIFSVQDEITEKIATALDRTFLEISTRPVDPAIYDQYLRARPRSYAPDELRKHVSSLEEVTRSAPDYADAWGRLAYLRTWLHFYEPFADRRRSAELVQREAANALAIDTENVDAMAAKLFVIPPFGQFVDAYPILEKIQRASGAADGQRYVGWFLRTFGFIREALEETERSYLLDRLDPMSINLLALARMSAGLVDEAIPLYEQLVERIPDMSFPVSSLLRAYTIKRDWRSVDRLLKIAEQRQLREFEDGLLFIRAKREATADNINTWYRNLQLRVDSCGSVEFSGLVYTAHLGLVDEAYQLIETCRLGPTGSDEDIMGPDGYRTALMFQADLPELRNDPRFARLCARLGLVEFWTTTDKWPDCAEQVPYDFRGECAKVQGIPIEKFQE